MKKLSLILIAGAIVGLIGCGNSNPKPKYPTYPNFDHDLIENVAPKPQRVVPPQQKPDFDSNLINKVAPKIPKVSPPQPNPIDPRYKNKVKIPKKPINYKP